MCYFFRTLGVRGHLVPSCLSTQHRRGGLVDDLPSETAEHSEDKGMCHVAQIGVGKEVDTEESCACAEENRRQNGVNALEVEGKAERYRIDPGQRATESTRAKNAEEDFHGSRSFPVCRDGFAYRASKRTFRISGLPWPLLGGADPGHQKSGTAVFGVLGPLEAAKHLHTPRKGLPGSNSLELPPCSQFGREGRRSI